MTQPQSSKTILVVDDQACIRQVLEIALRRAGFDVLVAASGLEALMVYQQHGSHISAVLLDVCMPDWDGPRTLAVLPHHTGHTARLASPLGGQALDLRRSSRSSADPP